MATECDKKMEFDPTTGTYKPAEISRKSSMVLSEDSESPIDDNAYYKDELRAGVRDSGDQAMDMEIASKL